MFEWDEKKNKEILARHGVDFKTLVEQIINENFVTIDVPNKDRNQEAFLVPIDGYPYVVPFEERGENIRLITAWPDRRYKK